jgi:hypothetical protein
MLDIYTCAKMLPLGGTMTFKAPRNPDRCFADLAALGLHVDAGATLNMSGGYVLLRKGPARL